ncbi:MAG: phosphatase PAP2 family protein [Firmicutes bacterium]|nr:phosphatase PAP2 family protein [Bacillota bacterium]
MKKSKTHFLISAVFLTAFLLWTAALRIIDVQAIGPLGSSVGLATINQFFRDLIGVHLSLYIITDWLSLIPFFICIGFGILGLSQWIKRKQLRKVDTDILILGGFYLVVISSYLLFEQVVINYRPVLIEGILEVSYPSSTTILVLCVMITAMLQIMNRMKKHKGWVTAVCAVFTAFMVIGRLLSGVHWFTDIIVGILLSTGLIAAYGGAVNFYKKRP